MTITFADNSALIVGFEVPLEMLAAFHLRVQDQSSTLLRLAPHREWRSRCRSRWPGNAQAERTQPVNRPNDFLDDSQEIQTFIERLPEVRHVDKATASFCVMVV